MRSLAAHLRDPDSHDTLPFHPSCPICRETRLTGLLPAAELVPKRTQAMLAAGVLAVSAIGPAAAAVAAEQDQQQDGTTEVGQGAPPDSADSPDFDPGGDATDLPDAPAPAAQAPAPADPGSDDTGPVDQAPATDTGDPVVDPGDGPAQPAAQQAPATQTTSVPVASTPTPTESEPAAQGAPAATDSPPPSPDTAPTPTSTPALTPATGPAAAPRRGTRAAGPTARRQRHKRAKHPQQPVPVPETAAPRPTSAAPALATTAPTAAATVSALTHPAKPGDRTHTVVAGESLWAIAGDLLGADASPARIAREVHRLWQLNADRIGTGDPDLLLVGTRLSLR